jgi:hypothetical protein
VIRYSHGPVGSDWSSNSRSSARTCTRSLDAVTIIAVAPACGDPGSAVETTTPEPVACASRATSQLNRTSRASGRYAVRGSSVDSGRAGSRGQLTVGSFTDTGANGISSALTTATRPASPASTTVAASRRVSGAGVTASILVRRGRAPSTTLA